MSHFLKIGYFRLYTSQTQFLRIGLGVYTACRSSETDLVTIRGNNFDLGGVPNIFVTPARGL